MKIRSLRGARVLVVVGAAGLIGLAATGCSGGTPAAAPHDQPTRRRVIFRCGTTVSSMTVAPAAASSSADCSVHSGRSTRRKTTSGRS